MDQQVKSNLVTRFHPLSPDLSEDEDLLPRDSVNLLTYNIFLWPPPVRTNESDHKEDRLKSFADQMERFDIICCQEAFMPLSSWKSKLITYANMAGFFNVVNATPPGALSWCALDSGLVIMSRFPIVEKDEMLFWKYFDVDAFANKGALYAKIQIGTSHLHLFNTHT